MATVLRTLRRGGRVWQTIVEELPAGLPRASCASPLSSSSLSPCPLSPSPSPSPSSLPYFTYSFSPFSRHPFSSVSHSITISPSSTTSSSSSSSTSSSSKMLSVSVVPTTYVLYKLPFSSFHGPSRFRPSALQLSRFSSRSYRSSSVAHTQWSSFRVLMLTGATTLGLLSFVCSNQPVAVCMPDSTSSLLSSKNEGEGAVAEFVERELHAAARAANDVASEWGMHVNAKALDNAAHDFNLSLSNADEHAAVQFLIGAAGGTLVGYGVKFFGHILASTVMLGGITLVTASHLGIIEIDWKHVAHKLEKYGVNDAHELIHLETENTLHAIYAKYAPLFGRWLQTRMGTGFLVGLGVSLIRL